METESFVNLIKKFGNVQNQGLDSLYPYGKFPIEKTKGYNPFEKKVSAQNFNAETEEITNNQVSQPQSNGLFGSLDLKTLLPLITNMKNKNKFTTYDLFNLIIPSLTKNNSDLKDLIKFFSSNPSSQIEKTSTLPPSKMQSIDSYVKA